MLDLALTDRRLTDAADVRTSRHRRNIQADLQRDFASRVHVRRHVNVYAHVDILKLSIHQWVDAYATNSWLERTGRYRHPVANLQRRLLPIQRADLRVLDHLRLAVAHQGGGGNGRNCDGKVRGIQVPDPVQVDPPARARTAACGRRGSRGSRGSRGRTGGRIVDVVVQRDRGAGGWVDSKRPAPVLANLEN